MDDSPGGAERKKAAEELILRTIAAHAESLLRTARRHSMCVDDAQDAYQRAIELFMGHAGRLDAARAPGWLHVVIKREALAIQKARRKLVLSAEVDLDGHEARSGALAGEQLLSFDLVSRSAEALKRLRPQEVRALWLRAQGHSYSDISAMTGWSYTKVNRCVSEGARRFLEHYEGIESGEACKRWLPVLSAMVDGEASAELVMEVRPHLRNCPGCRATLRALRDSSRPLAALMPVPLAVVESGAGDQAVQLAMRLYESFATSLHERAINSVTKAHAVLEASAAGKVAAVAASAAAVAGGGYASVGQLSGREAPAAVATMRAAVAPATADEKLWAVPTARIPAAVKQRVAQAASPASNAKRGEVARSPVERKQRRAPEFSSAVWARSMRTRPASAANAPAAYEPRASASEAKAAAPEFASRGPAPEFGP